MNPLEETKMSRLLFEKVWEKKNDKKLCVHLVDHEKIKVWENYMSETCKVMIFDAFFLRRKFALLSNKAPDRA